MRNSNRGSIFLSIQSIVTYCHTKTMVPLTFSMSWEISQIQTPSTLQLTLAAQALWLLLLSHQPMLLLLLLLLLLLQLLHLLVFVLVLARKTAIAVATIARVESARAIIEDFYVHLNKNSRHCCGANLHKINDLCIQSVDQLQNEVASLGGSILHIRTRSRFKVLNAWGSFRRLLQLLNYQTIPGNAALSTDLYLLGSWSLRIKLVVSSSLSLSNSSSN